VKTIKIKANQLAPGILWDADRNCGCAVGHMLMANGVPPELLHGQGVLRDVYGDAPGPIPGLAIERHELESSSYYASDSVRSSESLIETIFDTNYNACLRKSAGSSNPDEYGRFILNDAEAQVVFDEVNLYTEKLGYKFVLTKNKKAPVLT
jgi:hypothetical protein